MRPLLLLFLGFLTLLTYRSRARAADPARLTPQVTAWGKPAQGLQAGIRCRKASLVLKPGEEAEFVIVLRNATHEPVTLHYWPDGHYWGEPGNRMVEITVMHSFTGPEPHPYTTSLLPGQELVLGALILGHVRPKLPNTAYIPRSELPPGKYKVGAAKLSDVVEVTLGTGSLSLELRRK